MSFYAATRAVKDQCRTEEDFRHDRQIAPQQSEVCPHEMGLRIEGEVVLVNIWATWCGPCREEMPKLDRLYRERKDHGFIVFGLSDEDVDLQRKYLEQVLVSYPLLTVSGEVPNFYRDIARYPAIFLIDRRGRLEPAPGPDQPFEKVGAAVDVLLNSGGPMTR
jgi:thiol-disulfide isomerase/thioredoxin